MTHVLFLGEQTYNEETDGNRTFSDGEGDTSRATDPDSALSPQEGEEEEGAADTLLPQEEEEGQEEGERPSLRERVCGDDDEWDS